MTHPDAERWDARYTEELDSWLARQPRQLLQEYAHLLPAAGRALDAAAGVGTNSLFLARRGLRVLALDISEVALRAARARFADLGLYLDAAVMDLARPRLPISVFDVIVNFHFLERSTFKAFHRALKPGGVLIFETFVEKRGEVGRPEYFLKPGELSDAFAGLETIHQEECVLLDEDGALIRRTEQLVARKPN